MEPTEPRNTTDDANETNAPVSYAAPYRNIWQAIKVCFSKYADSTGRASRSEYWWFFLFTSLVNIMWLLFLIAGSDSFTGALIDGPLAYAVPLVLLTPGIAVAVRRLHDMDHSGWWLWLGLGPVVGAAYLPELAVLFNLPALAASFAFIVMFASSGLPEKNRYDEATKNSAALAR